MNDDMNERPFLLPLLDQFVTSLEGSNRAELEAAVRVAKRNAHDFGLGSTHRRLWRTVVSLLEAEIGRF